MRPKQFAMRTRIFGYLSWCFRSLRTFYDQLLCNRRRQIFAYTSFGFLSFIFLHLRLKERNPSETTIPADREPADAEAQRKDNDPYHVEPTDTLFCDYDTTWETPGEPERHRRYGAPTHGNAGYQFKRFENAARDMYNYRHDYPLSTGGRNHLAEGNDMPNLDFYLGKRPSVPDGFYIDGFHQEWHGQYHRLEQGHAFIQWLFPLQEQGMNSEAYELTKQEIEAFRNNAAAKLNLRKSYCLMLDFYGIELSNPETGEVRRASNWQERFQNLNRHTHNNLRLTRILKSLGTLGFRQYQAPLVRLLLEETLVHGTLPAVKESALNYFLFAVLDRAQRRELVRFAFLHYEPKEEFVWCPKRIQELFLLEESAAALSHPAP